MSRVGIYGGTFDPIHLGHLRVITSLFEKDLIDQLLVVPAGQPLLRKNAPLATGAQRRAMCQLAINELEPEIRSKVEVNPIEIPEVAQMEIKRKIPYFKLPIFNKSKGINFQIDKQTIIINNHKELDKLILESRNK